MNEALLVYGVNMKDNIAAITYNLSFIIKRLEELLYEAVDYEIEEKIKQLNEKVYELSDTLETIEVLLE
jgi:hypothetical protein